MKMRAFDNPRSPGGFACIRPQSLGPGKHCKVIKHFVITRYINSTIEWDHIPSTSHPHSVWPVSLDFLLALFQVQMEHKVYWQVVMMGGGRQCGGYVSKAGVKLYSSYWQVSEGVGGRESSGRRG